MRGKCERGLVIMKLSEKVSVSGNLEEFLRMNFRMFEERKVCMF